MADDSWEDVPAGEAGWEDVHPAAPAAAPSLLERTVMPPLRGIAKGLADIPAAGAEVAREVAAVPGAIAQARDIDWYDVLRHPEQLGEAALQTRQQVAAPFVRAAPTIMGGILGSVAGPGGAIAGATAGAGLGEIALGSGPEATARAMTPVAVLPMASRAAAGGLAMAGKRIFGPPEPGKFLGWEAARPKSAVEAEQAAQLEELKLQQYNAQSERWAELLRNNPAARPSQVNAYETGNAIRKDLLPAAKKWGEVNTANYAQVDSLGNQLVAESPEHQARMEALTRTSQQGAVDTLRWLYGNTFSVPSAIVNALKKAAGPLGMDQLAKELSQGRAYTAGDMRLLLQGETAALNPELAQLMFGEAADTGPWTFSEARGMLRKLQTLSAASPTITGGVERLMGNLRTGIKQIVGGTQVEGRLDAANAFFEKYAPFRDFAEKFKFADGSEVFSQLRNWVNAGNVDAIKRTFEALGPDKQLQFSQNYVKGWFLDAMDADGNIDYTRLSKLINQPKLAAREGQRALLGDRSFAALHQFAGDTLRANELESPAFGVESALPKYQPAKLQQYKIAQRLGYAVTWIAVARNLPGPLGLKTAAGAIGAMLTERALRSELYAKIFTNPRAVELLTQPHELVGANLQDFNQLLSGIAASITPPAPGGAQEGPARGLREMFLNVAP